MFGLFRKKDPKVGIMERYRALLAESHRLSTIDRKASDLKRAEAEEVLKELDALVPPERM
ncbi:MAG: Lacal_2735 family protein [Flavobacteriales bacterium]|nr:Lacal_2735 family protein [Flavobacteriales bacterium]